MLKDKKQLVVAVEKDGEIVGVKVRDEREDRVVYVSRGRLRDLFAELEAVMMEVWR